MLIWDGFALFPNLDEDDFFSILWCSFLFDVFDVKKDVIQTLVEAGYDRQSILVRDKSPSYYHPGKAGSVYLDKDDTKPVAYFGDIHPNIIKKLIF